VREGLAALCGHHLPHITFNEFNMKDIIGIDIGGVLIKPAETKGDTSFFSDDYLATPEFEGAAEIIRRLKDERFGDHMHLVSKCGPKVQRKSLDWLEHHDFYARSGLDRANVHFCLERPDKAVICKQLGVNVFIDDRLDVLGYLEDVPTRIQFCGSARARDAEGDGSFDFVKCASWQDVADMLLEPK